MKSSRSISVESGKWRQFLAAIIEISRLRYDRNSQMKIFLPVNTSTFSYGTVMGWASPVIQVLMSPNNPISQNPLAIEEISWLNSVLCIVNIPMLPISSIVAEKFGRKMTGYIMAILFGVSWLITIFANRFYLLMIARILGGVGGAFCFFLIPLYVSEISGDSIRGFLGTFMLFGLNIGIFVAYVLGAVLSYQILAIVSFIFPMIFFGCFIFMPETPAYLVRKGRMTDAAKSLMWLKNGDKSTVNHELLRLQTSTQENVNPDKSVNLRDLFRDRATIKGLIISLALLCGQQTCGITAMVTYTYIIFRMAGSSLSPSAATIIIGGIQIFGSLLSSIFMERAGRRPLILISCFGMLLCHCTIATFLLLQSKSMDVSSFGWIPLVTLAIYVIVYCLGMGPAPFIVTSEVFRPDIAGLGISTSMTIMVIVAFMILKFFPFAITYLKLHGCFYLFGAFCGCTFIFTYFFMPETKGRSIESIIDELNGSSRRIENGYTESSAHNHNTNVPTFGDGVSKPFWESSTTASSSITNDISLYTN